jgi:hypothetical protein
MHRYLALLASFFLIPAQAHTITGWNFTPNDYEKLVRRGGDLRFEADSNWLPPAFQENLLSTLKFALRPNARPRHTSGINELDFYHGHIVCIEATRTTEISFRAETIHDQIFDPARFSSLNAQNIGAYQTAMRKMESLSGAALRQLLASPPCEFAVVYHTYELVVPRQQPNLAPNDSLRNLLTCQSDLLPTPFSPRRTAVPNFDGPPAKPDFWEILQIAFLIDPDGVVHVTQGSLNGLYRFTGKISDF